MLRLLVFPDYFELFSQKLRKVEDAELYTRETLSGVVDGNWFSLWKERHTCLEIFRIPVKSELPDNELCLVVMNRCRYVVLLEISHPDI